ncbi:cell division protein FtsZ [Candidatus Babeliales bacterium]|nr:cell division protein FtsZ [Candidatus Babeliales bacterium]MCF7899518.1 cell division protein FtsZ [Candidatus Babeliales bacterium]
MIELNVQKEEPIKFGACLKVIGVGGGGGNAINSMIESADLDTVEFVVANTDAQALSLSKASYKIQLGAKLTRGLGAGSNPDIGRRAAQEDLDPVLEKISDADILFLTAGLGGGTGSGAIPIIAKAAKDLGILTVAIVTRPFVFEGKRRLQHAQDSLENLKENVDTIIVVPNQKLLEVADPKISMLDAFAMSDDVLKQAIKGISDIITKTGYINVDFADVKEVMKGMGLAIMGTGVAEGADRAKQAAMQALCSPLLEDVSIQGARGILLNITGNTDLGLHEINEAAAIVNEKVNCDAHVILGSVIDPNIGNQVKVTVIATGFNEQQSKKTISKENVFAAVKDDIKSVDKNYNDDRINEKIVLKIKEEGNDASLNNQVNYDLNDLDTPTFLRKKQEQNVNSQN